MLFRSTGDKTFALDIRGINMSNNFTWICVCGFVIWFMQVGFAYLRVVHQSLDDLSFERIINIPKRSIGNTTIKNINECAKKNNCSLEVASKKLIEENKIKHKTKIGLSSLLNFLKKWRNDLKNNTNHNKLLQIILDESGYSE